jgi:hypothetical protein
VRIARVLAAPLVTLILVGCSGSAERTLLAQFFAASRLRDLTAVRNFSTVVFEPASDGIITGFDVTGVTAVNGPDGRPMSKDVSMAAPVRLPSGEIVRKAFVVTMSRGIPGSDQYRMGQWMIIGIKDAPASPSTPRP